MCILSVHTAFYIKNKIKIANSYIARLLYPYYTFPVIYRVSTRGNVLSVAGAATPSWHTCGPFPQLCAASWDSALRVLWMCYAPSKQFTLAPSSGFSVSLCVAHTLSLHWPRSPLSPP